MTGKILTTTKDDQRFALYYLDAKDDFRYWSYNHRLELPSGQEVVSLKAFLQTIGNSNVIVRKSMKNGKPIYFVQFHYIRKL